MDRLSDDDREIIAKHPLHNALDDVRFSLRAVFGDPAANLEDATEAAVRASEQGILDAPLHLSD
jgi:hypothetical protein